jgi:hypothetical protein
MKRLIPVLMFALLSFAEFAQAETVDLYTTLGFGCLHQFHNIGTSVPNTTATAYLPQSGVGGMTLWFSDQVNPVDNSFYSYYTGTYGGNAVPTLLRKCVFENSVCVPNGEVLTVTLNQTSYTTQINSGRAHYSCTHWTLQSGVIERADPSPS